MEGGGQPVLSFKQCFILFSSFPLLLAFVVEGLGFEVCVFVAGWSLGGMLFGVSNNNNNNRRLVTLAEHTSDHGRQTNSSTEEKGEQV